MFYILIKKKKSYEDFHNYDKEHIRGLTLYAIFENILFTSKLSIIF